MKEGEIEGRMGGERGALKPLLGKVQRFFGTDTATAKADQVIDRQVFKPYQQIRSSNG